MVKKVLVVDVPSPERDSLVEALRSRGHQAAVAESPESARGAVKKERPDLIIVNILIPGHNGLELLQSLRSMHEAKFSSYLVLTLTDRISEVAGPESLISDYLIKPADLDAVHASVKKAMGGKGKHILMAEDDPDLAELLSVYLRSKKYEITLVSDGDKVADAVRREKPDLVLLDLMLPGRDGFQVLRDLKGYPSTENIPIVVLTAMHLNTYQDQGLLTGEPEIIANDVPLDFVLGIIETRLAKPAPDGGGRAPVVLLADDEPQILSIIHELLVKEGYVVRTASDGQEALDSIRKDIPDIAVLDFMMPRKNGIEVCAALKNDPETEFLPVILLSGTAELDTRVEGLNLGADDFITKPVDVKELLARIRMVLKRTQGVLAANPLTHLPGNVSIETRINDALKKGLPLDVLYVDLNHFKAYNDAYGFEAGDRAIKATADMLVRITRKEHKEFIGHIGGDDFIVLSHPDRSEALAQRIIQEFVKLAPTFYSAIDRYRGYIVSTDRTGAVQKFPLLTLAVGIVTNRHRHLESLGEISQIGAEVKKKAKSMGGNSFYVDKRKD